MAAKKISIPEKVLALGISISGIAVIVAYILTPTDLIPDFIGIWGFVDDVIASIVITRITLAVGKILTGHKDIFKVGNPLEILKN